MKEKMLIFLLCTKEDHNLKTFIRQFNMTDLFDIHTHMFEEEKFLRIRDLTLYERGKI